MTQPPPGIRCSTTASAVGEFCSTAPTCASAACTQSKEIPLDTISQLNRDLVHALFKPDGK